MSIDLRQYERFNTRVGASAARPPLVPRPFADAESLAFDRRGQAARAGLESGTAVLLDVAERVAAPEPDPEALRGLTRVAETARARLPEGSRDYLDAVGPVTASVVTPLEERRRQAAMVGLAGALTQQKAVLRRLALLGAPLSTLRAVAKGQVEKLHAAGLMAGDRATLERAWDEELAGNHLLGRLDKDTDLPLAEQPEAGLLEPETLLHLEGLQRQRQAARRGEQLGGVLQGAVSGAAAGRAPSAEQAAALEGELPGLGQAAAREAQAWHQKQDAILGLVERNPLLGKLKDFAGGGPLYRRLLVEQQRRAGVPEDALRIWDQGESDAAVAGVLALPDETAPAAERSAALLDYARQHLAGLPAELRPLALAELTRRGLAPEDAAALDAVAGDLAARRDIAALATARGWARQAQAGGASTAAGLVQIADSGQIASDADPDATGIGSQSASEEAESSDTASLSPALPAETLAEDPALPDWLAGLRRQPDEDEVAWSRRVGEAFDAAETPLRRMALYEQILEEIGVPPYGLTWPVAGEHDAEALMRVQGLQDDAWLRAELAPDDAQEAWAAYPPTEQWDRLWGGSSENLFYFVGPDGLLYKKDPALESDSLIFGLLKEAETRLSNDAWGAVAKGEGLLKFIASRPEFILAVAGAGAVSARGRGRGARMGGRLSVRAEFPSEADFQTYVKIKQSGVPLGFADKAAVQAAADGAKTALKAAGIEDGRLALRGSAVTGRAYNRKTNRYDGPLFDKGVKPSDLDFAIVSPKLFRRVLAADPTLSNGAGFTVRINADRLEKLGFNDLARWLRGYRRETSIMVFQSPTALTGRGASMWLEP